MNQELGELVQSLQYTISNEEDAELSIKKDDEDSVEFQVVWDTILDEKDREVADYVVSLVKFDDLTLAKVVGAGDPVHVTADAQLVLALLRKI